MVHIPLLVSGETGVAKGENFSLFGRSLKMQGRRKSGATEHRIFSRAMVCEKSNKNIVCFIRATLSRCLFEAHRSDLEPCGLRWQAPERTGSRVLLQLPQGTVSKGFVGPCHGVALICSRADLRRLAQAHRSELELVRSAACRRRAAALGRPAPASLLHARRYACALRAGAARSCPLRRALTRQTLRRWRWPRWRRRRPVHAPAGAGGPWSGIRTRSSGFALVGAHSTHQSQAGAAERRGKARR